MATHNFQIFDESMTDTMTDIDYQTDTQRTNGVIPGVASPLLHNKLYRQCSVMAYALAQVMVARGYDAPDSDPATLVNSIQRAFAFSVNGDKPNSTGAILTGKPIDAWPVGSIFMTMSNANPATLLGGGTWTKIEGKYLLASASNYTAGSDYGSMTKTISVSNLPAHTHGFTTDSAGTHGHTVSGTAASNGAHTHTGTAASNGAHTHDVSATAASNGLHSHDVSTVSAGAHTHSVSGTSGEAGSHSHTRGTMNITGEVNVDMDTAGSSSGALKLKSNREIGFSRTASGLMGKGIILNASDGWTGATSVVSNHTHSFSATTSNAGAHTHTGTAASAGAHTHSVTGTAAQNGAHTHSVTTVSAGAHTHNVSATAANNGAHVHTGTTGSTGGGTAIDIKPLSIAVNVWRRTA